VFAFEESHSEVYTTYDLMGEEEVIFYDECEEPFVLGSPSLVLEKFSLTSMHQWLIPWMIPLDKFGIYIAHDLKAIVDVLSQKYGYKFKNADLLAFHFGCDFFHDSDGTLCFDPIKYIQSMIGALQWVISLGRLDICTAIMTMSCFCVAPCKGHC